MKRGGRVVVIELTLDPTNQPGVAPLADLSMMILTGGRERTIDEYGDLFAAAGFRLTRPMPTDSRLVMMEAETYQTRL
jgi:hypothetical protein